jgi:DNA-binding transcriptional regulator PaaX
LKKLGFAQWQISVWVSPHPVIEKLDFLLIKHGLKEYCSVHESKRVVGISDKKFARKIWKLDEIDRDYRRIIDDFEESKKLEYLEKLMKDPFLPKGLLPNDYLWNKLMKKVVGLPN